MNGDINPRCDMTKETLVKYTVGTMLSLAFFAWTSFVGTFCALVLFALVARFVWLPMEVSHMQRQWDKAMKENKP